MAYQYVVDKESGTYFNAANARLVFDSAFGTEYDSILDSGSDSEIMEIAEELGTPVLNNDARALTVIASMLSHREWNSDLFDEIAELVRETGRDVTDIEG
jgi:hypothetical protein